MYQMAVKFNKNNDLGFLRNYDEARFARLGIVQHYILRTNISCDDLFTEAISLSF